MMDGIKKLSKAKKKNIDSINSANRVVACLVQYVNTVGQHTFQSIQEMKGHMAKTAKTNKTEDLLTIFSEADKRRIIETAKNNISSISFNIQNNKIELESKSKSINWA